MFCWISTVIDNPRWQTWLTMLRASDQTLVSIFTMAACAVLLWESLRRLPEPMGQWCRSVYLFALCMFLMWSINYPSTTQSVLLLAGVAVVWIGAQRWLQPKSK